MSLFQFEWRVVADGHEIKEARPAMAAGKKAPKPDEYLTDCIPLGTGAQWTVYSPLNASGLFRSFADLRTEPDEIRRFADRYGLLGGPATEMIVLPNDNRVHTGERLSVWWHEIVRFRRVIELWELVTSRRVGGLKKYIRWDDDGERVWYTSNPKVNGKGDSFGPGDEFSVIASRDIRPHLLERTQRGDLIQPTWFRLQQVINKALEERVSPRLLWDEGELGLYHVPDSLLGLMWLQFGQAISGHKEYRKCSQCSTWFELQPGVGRKDKKYCSDACRAAAYRARKEAKS